MDMNVAETVNSFQLFQTKFLETFLFDQNLILRQRKMLRCETAAPDQSLQCGCILGMLAQNAIGYRGHYTDKFILIPIL